MKERHCDATGCGRLITGPELARSPRTMKIEGVGAVTVSFSFKGRKPDVCDACLTASVAKMGTSKTNVVDLASRRDNK